MRQHGQHGEDGERHRGPPAGPQPSGGQAPGHQAPRHQAECVAAAASYRKYQVNSVSAHG